MAFNERETRTLHALVSREKMLLGLLDTKEMELERLLEHYRLHITLSSLEVRLYASLNRLAKIREAAAAATDKLQPS